MDPSSHPYELLSRPRHLFEEASEILVVLRKKSVDPLPLALVVLLLDHGVPMMPDTVAPVGEDIKIKGAHRHAKSVPHLPVLIWRSGGSATVVPS